MKAPEASERVVEIITTLTRVQETFDTNDTLEYDVDGQLERLESNIDALETYVNDS